jgi:REP element-mobilizing transposase RayT
MRRVGSGCFHKRRNAAEGVPYREWVALKGERRGGRSVQGNAMTGNGDNMTNDAHRPERKCHRLSAAVYADVEHAFYFTVSAARQSSPFTNKALAEKVVESLLWTRSQYHWLLFCYCLMPDHLHFVCRLTGRDVHVVNAGARGILPEGVLDHLGRFKSFTTNAYWKLGFHGTLWQKSSYDRVFDLEKPFEEVVQYVLDNPVRKGLVADWTQWPYAKIIDAWW